MNTLLSGIRNLIRIFAQIGKIIHDFVLDFKHFLKISCSLFFSPYPFLPCLYCLLTQESKERLQLLISVPCLQRLIIRLFVLLVDNNRRMVMKHKKIVHCQTPGTAIPVSLCQVWDKNIFSNYHTQNFL